jgi:hypothetical protein
MALIMVNDYLEAELVDLQATIDARGTPAQNADVASNAA